MSGTRQPPAPEHWREHFRDRHRRLDSEGAAASLDYSNERVRLQTYASLLEGLGRVAGRRVLDVGCGWGSLALALHGCGAEVVAIDLVAETIERLRGRYPFIDWRVADLERPAELPAEGAFDAVVAAEVLQYVDFAAAFAALWRRLRPGGRLVAAVPNADCPIARRVAARDPHWRPVSADRIEAVAGGLAGLAGLWLRGLGFAEDQTFLPYRPSPWGRRLDGTPNRIVLVAERAAG